ncbi:MAG: hypothetical protein K2M98_05590 [Muribaculum sp.]|nr:hypothetical protein [Muribaculum sp.]
MTDNQPFSLEEIKEQIKLKSPTQQIRYISSLQIPEEEDDLIAFITFLRDGALGNFSKFENVTNAYSRKYNEAFAKAGNRKLSHDIENLEIKLPKSAMVIRAILGIAAVVVVGIIVISAFSGHSNRSESAQSLSDVSNITDISAYEKQLAELEARTKEMEALTKKKEAEIAMIEKATSGSESDAEEAETDARNVENEYNIASGVALARNMAAWFVDQVRALTATESVSAVVEEAFVSEQNSNLPSEPVELEFAGTVANGDVIMQLTLDFEGNRAWGTYRYAKGAGEIVLMGDINVTEADEYAIKYTATLQELDNNGNPYGTFELNGNHSDFFDELNGKYISVKGKESNVLLSKN